MILAGGASRRWGGRDKTAEPLAGRPLLRHAVDAVLPDAAALVVVAPADHPARAGVEEATRRAGRPLTWTREDPPGGGPLAGLAAGVAGLAVPVDAVLVIAGDLPFARTAWPRLLAGLGPDAGRPDAVLGIDPQGRRQPLLAAYRTAVLRDRLARLDPANRPMRALLEGLAVVEVEVTAHEALDLDTPADARAAERVVGTDR